MTSLKAGKIGESRGSLVNRWKRFSRRESVTVFAIIAAVTKMEQAAEKLS